MNRSRHGVAMTTALMVLAGVALPGMAFGQIAPPPPQKPAETPVFTVPPAPPVQARPGASDAAADAARAAQAERDRANNIGFESLVQRDANGNIIPLEVPVEWAAFEKNPINREMTKAMAEPYLRERRARFETLVIDNIDIVERLDSGIIEQFDPSDRSRLSEMVQLVKPFQGMGTLTRELEKRRMLNGTQAAVSQRMVNDYTRQLTADRRKQAGLPEASGPGEKPAAGGQGADGVSIMARLMLETAIAEPLHFYRLMLVETGGRLSELGVPAEAAEAYAKATTDAQKAEAVKRAMASMSLEQKREFLRKSLSLRPPPPPLPDLEKVREQMNERIRAEVGTVPQARMYRGTEEFIRAAQARDAAIRAATDLEADAVTKAALAAEPNASREIKQGAAEARAKADDAGRKAKEAREALDALVKSKPEYQEFLDELNQQPGPR